MTRKKKKKIQYRVGPPIPKEKLLQNLKKKKYLKLVRNCGLKLN